MKDIVKILLLLPILGMVGCESWLDLKPETEATEDQVFSKGSGYRSVLNGLYGSMATADLYGRELSFGMLDCISQQYDLNTSVMGTDLYVQAGLMNYTSNELTTVIERVWKSAFNVIANANNLIQNIKDESPDVFKEGEMEKKLIMGEAYACRALMHFEMLRLFAPAPVNDDGGSYVPYIEFYPTIQGNGISVNSFLDKVIEDLENARNLVMEWDTCSLAQGLQITGKARFYNEFSFGTEVYSNSNKPDAFFMGRGYRLNYYAITALLARVYQYAGEDEKAFKYAKEIIDFEVADYYGKQSAFGIDDYVGVRVTSLDAKSDLKVISNLIFAVYNSKTYEEMDIDFYFKVEIERGTGNWFVVRRDDQKIFYTKDGVDESLKDYRNSAMVMLVKSNTNQYPVSVKWLPSTDISLRDKNLSILPVIRATELRYIMAEYYARQGNFTEAANILNLIRENRGCYEQVVCSSWEDFEEELIRDARREWISEGQLFYLYKRLDAEVDFGKNVKRPFNREEYLLPIPSNQNI